MSDLIANLAPAVGGLLIAIAGYAYARSLGKKAHRAQPGPVGSNEPFLPTGELTPKTWGGIVANVGKRRMEGPDQRITH